MDKSTQTCRLCLDPTSSESSPSMEDDTFRRKLSSVSNFTFDTGHHLPSRVCSECCDRVTEFYKFMETVRSNQDQLGRMEQIRIKAEEPIENESESINATVKERGSDDVDQDDAEGEQICHVEVNPSEKDHSDEDDAKDCNSSGMELDDDEDSVKKESEEISGDKSETVAEEDRLIKDYFSLGCGTCSKICETWLELTQHSKKAHKKKATVQCCNKTFSVKCKILHHINTHLKPCQCEICGKGYVDRYALNQHMVQKHTSNEDKPYKCDQCGQSFLKENFLKTHLKRHIQVKCPICEITLSNEYNLKTHVQNKHNKGDRFVCATCGKQFQSPYVLNSHIKKRHSNQPPETAACSICAKLINKDTLSVHINTVHHGKQVTCDICHKVYPYEKALRTHKSRVHVRTLLHCEICGKEFKRQLSLREHMASHTGEKLYSCEVCGVEMNSSANLYQHRKNKHPAEWLAKQK